MDGGRTHVLIVTIHEETEMDAHPWEIIWLGEKMFQQPMEGVESN